MSNQPLTEANELGKLLLQAGIALIKAGAGTNRVVMNVMRLAGAYGYEAQVDMGTRYINVSLHSKEQENIYSGSRTISSLPGANFKTIAEISSLSWAVTEKKMTVSEAGMELEKVIHLPEYHRSIVLVLVGLAGSSFCYTFGGNAVEMGITFLATVAGLFCKQELIRKKFNPYLVTYCSALLAALIIGIGWKAGIGSRLDHAFATCILFLIPGVPLINSILDIIDGYILNGIDRGINGIIHAFAIACGLATIIYIFQVQ